MVTLEIPGDARRTASLVGRKIRAERALVLHIEGDAPEVKSDYDNTVVYRVGEIVAPDSYDDDIRAECTHGIHAFLTEEEAREWRRRLG